MADIGFIAGIIGIGLLIIPFFLYMLNILKYSSPFFSWSTVLGWFCIAYYSYVLQLWIFTILSIALALLRMIEIGKVKNYLDD